MNSVLKALCLILGGTISIQAFGLLDAGSAYERLRIQFERAHKPALKELLTDSIWYCSGSLEAAKGQLRYVPFWEARYLFAPSEQQVLSNTLDPNNNWFEEGESAVQGVSVVTETLRYYEFLRINATGDLIIEMATGESYSRQVTQRQHLPKAVSADALLAHQYIFCENPSRHDERQWGDEPFDRGHKKRAQDQGSF